MIYTKKLLINNFNENDYNIVDYGYYITTFDESNNYSFKPFHSYNLGSIPYIWANLDRYKSVNNDILVKQEIIYNIAHFKGFQYYKNTYGNYISL